MLPVPTVLVCALLLPVTVEQQPATQPAVVLWQRGQDYLRAGESDKAIPCFRESLQLDPELARNYLGLAAAYADLGRDNLAALNMGNYLERKPEHLAARLKYADMLKELQQIREARVQYERCIADGQDREDLDGEVLVHCHTTLVDIYEATADEYHEHLHRGLGLFQLACQRATLPDPTGELSVESLLFRAAGELMTARQVRHDEARASWYLHQIWARLGQKQPASRWLRLAEAGSLFAELTPAEKRGLALAWTSFQQEGRK